MDRQYTDRILHIVEAAAPVAGVGMNMQSFRNVELEVVMTGFTGTVKFAGSNADACPDFSASASLANPWDYVRTINQIDGTAVAGGTGISGTTTTSVTNLECNTNGFKWIAAIVTAASAGKISVRGKGYSNH